MLFPFIILTLLIIVLKIPNAHYQKTVTTIYICEMIILFLNIFFSVANNYSSNFQVKGLLFAVSSLVAYITTITIPLSLSLSYKSFLYKEDISLSPWGKFHSFIISPLAVLNFLTMFLWVPVFEL